MSPPPGNRFLPPREAFDDRSEQPPTGLLGPLGWLPGFNVFLQFGTQIVTRLWSAAYGHARAPEPHTKRVTLPGLPPGLTGLRLAHLSDLHCGPLFPPAEVRRLVARVVAHRPDLVLLTGDLLHRDAGVLADLGAALGGLGLPGSVFAVRGNHDRQVDPFGHRFREVLAGAGIDLLDNEARAVSRPGFPDLWVAGIDDLWEGRADPAAALRQIPAGQPYLFLTHSPDGAELLLGRQHEHLPTLVLAGHTHGGQISLPGYGPLLLPSAHGRRYAEGLVRHRGLTVHISNGIGVVEPPLRLGAPAEVPILELSVMGRSPTRPD